MATMTQNVMTLWSWPLLAGRLASDMVETAMGAQRVVGARMPTLATAMCNPLFADHRELNLMVSEKVSAFGKSQSAMTGTADTVKRASAANAQAARQVAGGAMLWPADWMKLAEANIAAFAGLALLPTSMLAPLHSGVTANDRRLRG